MNAMTPFPEVERVVIQCGEIKSAHHAINGRRWFWLEHFAADGTATSVWSGPSLPAAREAAAGWAELGFPISDRTGGL